MNKNDEPVVRRWIDIVLMHDFKEKIVIELQYLPKVIAIDLTKTWPNAIQCCDVLRKQLRLCIFTSELQQKINCYC